VKEMDTTNIVKTEGEVEQQQHQPQQQIAHPQEEQTGLEASKTTTKTRGASSSGGSSNSKDFNQFLGALEEYNPTFPENLTRYYMERAGFAIKDDRILKLVSLAADKVMSEVVYEAKQVSSLRLQGNKTAKRRSDRPADSLDADDLEASLSQFRVYIRKKKRKVDA
jgi:transcription initiation factor TFIID subunit 10